jgi:Spy/CpxP family protein refolding chaperone
MNYRTWSAAALAAAVALGSVTMFVRAADEPKPAAADAPKAETKAAAAEGEKKKPAKQPAKLVKPWSGLTSLSDDQSAKIRAIHRKALDEINVIKAREEQEITALLTDAQKSELKALVEADNAAKKAATPKKATAKSGDAPAKETAPAKAP